MEEEEFEINQRTATQPEQLMDDTEMATSIVEPGSETVAFVRERFSRAKEARLQDEKRWLQAYRNYRGIYGPDVQFTSTEKSKVFVKVTKTKVLAAYGQIQEVLFGNNRFPLSVDPTTLPEGVVESVHLETNPDLSSATEDMTLLPGETYEDWRERLGGMTEKLAPVEKQLRPGPATSPSAVEFSPAMYAAKKMEKKIHDQLEETDANRELRSVAFECALFGTGVMKGPFAEEKEYAKWDDDGKYAPVIKTIPKVSAVSIWNFYPDPEATNMGDAEYTVERHKLAMSSLRNLKNRPFFDENEVEMALQLGPSYSDEWWESELEDQKSTAGSERYEVLEFWGNVDVDSLKSRGITIPKKLVKEDYVQANIWICNDRVLRAVLNPFTPQRIPYHAVPFELNPYSFFGVGIAENMDDTQTLMNGFMRMAVDNAALSGNLIFEIDEQNLTPGQDLEVYPGKVFKRQAGAPGQAIFGTEFPNVSNQNMQLFDKARVLADESTGFPSFAHGQTGVSGVGRTASGISMLMGAANGSIRTVIKNVDDYLLAPLGKAFFSFNMQFNFDKEIVGDLEVKSRGTESLMANEVRSQRLMQFLSVVQNPVLAPFAKMDYIIREIAKAMELDPDKVVNSMGDAAIQAEMLKEWQAQNPQAAMPPQMPPGTNPADTQGSGGGVIGTGSVPGPQEPGFTGNAGTPPAPEEPPVQ
jgi:hypothetical protein